MNIKSKLTLAIGILVAMIVLLVVLSVVNLQILTATEPDSPAAGPGLQRALLWIYVVWCRMYMYWYWYVVASSRIN